MKRRFKLIPEKYLHSLLAAVLVVMIVQYMLLTQILRPVQLVSQILQLFCYMLLAVAVFRGVIQRSRIAWLVAQIMLAAMFAFSLLFLVISGILSLHTGNLWTMLGLAVIAAILNGILLGILFSLPVCDYFKPTDED